MIYLISFMPIILDYSPTILVTCSISYDISAIEWFNDNIISIFTTNTRILNDAQPFYLFDLDIQQYPSLVSRLNFNTVKHLGVSMSYQILSVGFPIMNYFRFVNKLDHKNYLCVVCSIDSERNSSTLSSICRY